MIKFKRNELYFLFNMIIVLGLLKFLPIQFSNVGNFIICCLIIIGWIAITLISKLQKFLLDTFQIRMWACVAVAGVSVFNSYTVFGQPLIHGLIAHKDFIFVIFLLFIYRVLKKQSDIEKFIKKTLTCLCWIWLAYIIIFNYVPLTPQLADRFPMIVGGGDYSGYVVKIEPSLIFLLLFIYIFKALGTQTYARILIILGILIVTLLIIDKRSLTVAFIVTLPISIYLRCGVRPFIAILLLYLSVGFLLMGLLYSHANIGLDRYVLALRTIILFETNDDVSAAARIHEISLGLPYVQSRPLLGNGMLSNNFYNGYESFVGYFFPSDVGLFGTIFVFGIIGSIVLYLPSYNVLLGSLSIKKSRKLYFFNAIFAYLLFLFLASLMKASIVLNPANILFPTVVLRAILDEYKQMEVSKW